MKLELTGGTEVLGTALAYSGENSSSVQRRRELSLPEGSAVSTVSELSMFVLVFIIDEWDLMPYG